MPVRQIAWRRWLSHRAAHSSAASSRGPDAPPATPADSFEFPATKKQKTEGELAQEQSPDEHQPPQHMFKQLYTNGAGSSVDQNESGSITAQGSQAAGGSSRFNRNLRVHGAGAEALHRGHLDLCAESGDSLDRLVQFGEESHQG